MLSRAICSSKEGRLLFDASRVVISNLGLIHPERLLNIFATTYFMLNHLTAIIGTLLFAALLGRFYHHICLSDVLNLSLACLFNQAECIYDHVPCVGHFHNPKSLLDAIQTYYDFRCRITVIWTISIMAVGDDVGLRNKSWTIRQGFRSLNRAPFLAGMPFSVYTIRSKNSFRSRNRKTDTVDHSNKDLGTSYCNNVALMARFLHRHWSHTFWTQCVTHCISFNVGIMAGVSRQSPIFFWGSCKRAMTHPSITFDPYRDCTYTCSIMVYIGKQAHDLYNELTKKWRAFILFVQIEIVIRWHIHTWCRSSHHSFVYKSWKRTKDRIIRKSQDQRRATLGGKMWVVDEKGKRTDPSIGTPMYRENGDEWYRCSNHHGPAAAVCSLSIFSTIPDKTATQRADT